MKKKTLVIATLTLSLFLAAAEGYSTYAATALKSQGRIVSNNDTSETADDVIFDASDLTTLNTAITNLDTRITTLSTTVDRGKNEIIDALEKYPDIDLKGANNGGDGDTNIPFTEIADVINNLTDIPADTYFYEEGTEGDAGIKRYKKVNGKYYECDENGQVVIDTKEANVEGKTLHDYAAAAAGNISAGSAAFSDGNLHLGDGSDNAAYYDRGVAAGAATAKVGTATADKVLADYTFTNSTGTGIAGTMVNRGDLNWNPTSGTTQTVQPGYYSGGTLDSSGAYAQGFVDGQRDVTQNLNITYTYHKHSDADGAEQGDDHVANRSGGCFTSEKRTSSYENCRHNCHYWEATSVDDYMDSYSCHISIAGTISNCGYSGGVLTGDYRNGYTHSVFTGGNLLGYTIGCGKTVNTIESAIIKY